MKHLLEKLKLFDKFIIDQFLFRFSILYIWTLITPIIYKLQGLYWTTSMISLYLICTRSAGLFVPYFKSFSLKQVYRLLIFLDMIYVLVTMTYFIAPTYFLLSEVFLTVVFIIFGELFHIKYNIYIVEKYGNEVFEDVSFVGSFIVSLSGILGYGTVMASTYFLDEAYSVAMFISFLVIGLIIQIYNYKKHYADM
jgi:hypothetical protein